MSSQSNTEELYGVSWSNPARSHLLCASNVMDYFCDLSNPFYDRQSNNEVIRMQRLHPDQLLCMTGIEFYLHHAQESILFVIRKQQRLSNTQVTPLAYYYIINGTVLQAPDLAALLNSRLLTTIVGLKKLLQTMAPCARYHPSDGSYSWDDPNILLGSTSELDSLTSTLSSASVSDRSKYVPANLFQVQRTGVLLTEWMNRFPLPPPGFGQAVTNPAQPSVSGIPITSAATPLPATTIKEENLQFSSNSPLKLPSKPPNLPGVGVVPGPIATTPSQSHLIDKKPRIQ